VTLNPHHGQQKEFAAHVRKWEKWEWTGQNLAEESFVAFETQDKFLVSD
jgi:hypothetical protein